MATRRWPMASRASWRWRGIADAAISRNVWRLMSQRKEAGLIGRLVEKARRHKWPSAQQHQNARRRRHSRNRKRKSCKINRGGAPVAARRGQRRAFLKAASCGPQKCEREIGYRRAAKTEHRPRNGASVKAISNKLEKKRK